jgi:chromosome segregation ATPase
VLQKDEVEQARRARGEMEERCRALVAEAQAEAEMCRKQRDEAVLACEKEKKERVKFSDKVERRDATILSLQARVTSLEQERESLRDTLSKVRIHEEKLLCQLAGNPYTAEMPDPNSAAAAALTPRATLIYQLKDQIASLEADKKRIHEASLATTLENSELIEELDRQTTGHQDVLTKNQEQAAEISRLNATLAKLANMLTEYLKQIQVAQKAQKEAEASAQGLVATHDEPAPLPTQPIELAQKYHSEYVSLHKFLQTQLSG